MNFLTDGDKSTFIVSGSDGSFTLNSATSQIMSLSIVGSLSDEVLELLLLHPITNTEVKNVIQ